MHWELGGEAAGNYLGQCGRMARHLTGPSPGIVVVKGSRIPRKYPQKEFREGSAGISPSPGNRPKKVEWNSPTFPETPELNSF